MIVYKSYKFKLNPSSEQKEKLNQFLGTSRFIYNYYLNEKIERYNKFSKNYFLNDMKSDLKELQSKYEWLKDVDGCLLRTTLEDLDNAYNKFFSKTGGFPKFKSKNNKESYRTVCIRSSYKGHNYENIKLDLKKKIIKLPKLGEVRIQGYRNLKKFDAKILNATISKEANKYYVSLCVEELISNNEFKLNKAVGIDLGVKDLVTASDGLKYKSISKISKYEKKLKGLQRWLSRSQKGSKNRYKIILKIQEVNQKIRNARKYHTHLITKNLLENNDIVFVETLKVQSMLQEGNHNLARRIANSSFSEIIRQLEYKAEWQNKKIIRINTYYPSSQLCSCCGNKNEKVKDLNIRKWTCSNCNNENDRDINASENILMEGLKIYFKEILRTN